LQLPLLELTTDATPRVLGNISCCMREEMTMRCYVRASVVLLSLSNRIRKLYEKYSVRVLQKDIDSIRYVFAGSGNEGEKDGNEGKTKNMSVRQTSP
jgi:hypothetical protein